MINFNSKSVRILLLLCAIVAMVVLGVSINSTARSGDVPEDLRDLLVKQPAALETFNLVDQQKQVFNKERFKGAWTFLFFGYTHCPDVCPTTLTELDNAASRIDELKTADRKIQYVFVSVDPGRDTPESLGSYVSYFGAQFIAATGSEAELRRLAKPLGIKFERGIGTDTEYLVNHSSAMLLIDPQGRYYARFRAPHYSEEIFENFKKVVTYSESQ